MITLRIPATSANLGPGFDCMGLALDLWNTFELHDVPFHVSHDAPAPDSARQMPIAVESYGEGAGSLPSGADNLVAQTMLAELERLDEGRRTRGTKDGDKDSAQSSFATGRSSFRIVCRNDVPCASGLGSSSTAVLAGLLFAHALQCDDMNLAAVLTRATQIEGHGDNVAPALFGGLILVSYDGNSVVAAPVPIHPLRVVVCVPSYRFLTNDARAALPRVVNRGDAVFNVGRAMLVVEALHSGSDTLLARAMGDRIHEPYRIPAIPGAAEARQQALDHGATAVCLSGAGPGLLAFARDHHDPIGQAMQMAFARAGLASRYWVLDSSPRGVDIQRS